MKKSYWYKSINVLINKHKLEILFVIINEEYLQKLAIQIFLIACKVLLDFPSS